MPGYSVLTNPGAASAVLNLNKTLTALNMTQERINTGLRVGKARDDASTFAIALGMRSDIAGFKSVRENLSLGKSTLGVASAAGEQIADQLKDIKAKIVQASNNSQGRDLIQESIDNAIEQIKAITNAATFNGINLINGDEANIGKELTVVSSLDRNAVGDLSLGTVDVAYEDLSIEDRDRGLGAIKDLDVTAGKVIETKIERDDPVSAEITLADATAAGETFSFEYVDAEGETQTLSFSIAAAPSGNFQIAQDAGGNEAATSLETNLNALMATGGPLAGLGFTVSRAGDTVTITRDPAAGEGGIAAGFSVGAANGTLIDDPASANLIVQQAHGGVAQIELEFQGTSRLDISDGSATELQAGDTIDLVFNNGTNESKFTFVVGEQGDPPQTNGALIPGSAQQYYLNYADAVGTTTSAVTVSSLASRIEAALTGATDINTDIDGFLAGAGAPGTIGATGSGAGFTVQAVGGSVVITDEAQLASNVDHRDKLVSFNMDSAPGGTLDFELMLQQLDQAENHLKQVVGRIGAAEQRIESQSTFIDNLVKAINDGVGTLVDADMSEESARFQALQVQQQLGLQALSIANAQPQSILSLFGG